MFHTNATRPIARLVARARRGLRDARGTAAIEFAELAPILLLMLLGSIEVSRAVSMDRRFGMVTAMTGDLITRESTIDDTQLDAIMNIISFLMKPYDASTLKAVVLSIKANPNNANDTKVDWAYSYPSSTPKPTACSAYTLPTDLVAKGGSVVVVETKYDYKPLFLSYVGDPMKATTWTDKSTHSPRQSSCVDKNGTNCVSACF